MFTRTGFRGLVTLLLGVLLALLANGCVISNKPLISQSVFPIRDETNYQSYVVARDGSIAPSLEGGQVVIRRIEIKGGIYHLFDPGAREQDTNAMHYFKLAEAPVRGRERNSFWIVMHGRPNGKDYLYTALERKGNLFVDYFVTKDNFLKFIKDSGRQDSTNWETRADSDSITVESLAFLQDVLPKMVAGGYFESATAYGPPNLGTLERKTSKPSYDEPSREEMIEAFRNEGLLIYGCDIVEGCSFIFGSTNMKLVYFEKISCNILGNGRASCVYRHKFDCSSDLGDPRNPRVNPLYSGVAAAICTDFGANTRVFIRKETGWLVSK